MVNMSTRQQHHRDEKCQLKTTHGFSIRGEETLIPQGNLRQAPKQYCTQIQRSTCTYISQQHKSKLKVKTKQYIPWPESSLKTIAMWLDKALSQPSQY